MADQEKPEIKLYDLTREIPSGITLSGLSEPKFDGVNYFRQPIGSSHVGFRVTQPSFVQLEYQLYSPTSAITGRTSLNGQPLGPTTFPAGKFSSNSLLGQFVEPGHHQFTVAYSCTPACREPFSQYWTKLRVIDASGQKPVEDVGLGVVRWNQYAPASSLQLQGTGPLGFDGVNFFRVVEKEGFQLDWPSKTKVLNASFLVNGNQNFEVVTRLGQEILTTERGNPKQGTYIQVGLVGKATENGLTVEVKCLTTPQTPCSTLYFPRIGVQTPPPAWQTSFPGAAFGAIILCALAWWGLGLSPQRGPAYR